MATPTYTFQIWLDGSFRDVTADTKSVSIKYGRERILDSFRAGQAVLSLVNNDNKYGPLTGGTYGDSQWINAEVRIAANINSASVPTTLFRGTVEDVDVVYPDSKDSTVIVKVFDGMSKLAKTELVDTTFAQEVGSTRFTNVLNNSQVNYPSTAVPKTRSIDTSTITMAGADVAQISTATYLERLAFSEDGAIFVYHGQPGGAAVATADRANILAYRKRDSTGSATGLTFGAGDGTAATEPPFTKVETSYGNELLFTRGVYSRQGEDPISYDENVVGQPAYGIRTIVRNNLLNLNDSDLEDAMERFVALHSTPALRVKAVVCKPLSFTDAQAEKVAKLTLYDSIRAQFQPAGASSELLQTLRVESIQHDLTPKNWTMRVGTSGSGDTVFLILDSADFGILNQNKLAP